MARNVVGGGGSTAQLNLGCAVLACPAPGSRQPFLLMVQSRAPEQGLEQGAHRQKVLRPNHAEGGARGQGWPATAVTYQ